MSNFIEEVDTRTPGSSPSSSEEAMSQETCGRRTVAGTLCKRKIPCAMHGVERPKATARWSVSEHLQFLTCLKVIGRGKWNSMANAIPSKTPSQIKSHAYSYFKRQRSSKKNSSLNDIHLADYQGKSVSCASSCSEILKRTPNNYPHRSTGRESATRKCLSLKTEEDCRPFLSTSTPVALSVTLDQANSFPTTYENLGRSTDTTRRATKFEDQAKPERKIDQPGSYLLQSYPDAFHSTATSIPRSICDSSSFLSNNFSSSFITTTTSYPHQNEIEYAKNISVSNHYLSCAPWISKKDLVQVVREAEEAHCSPHNQEEKEISKMETVATTISTDSGDLSDLSLESLMNSFIFSSTCRSSFSFTTSLPPTEENEVESIPEQNTSLIDDDVMSSWMEEIIQI